MEILGRGRIPLDASDGIIRGAPVHITVDGESLTAFDGETVAAAMAAEKGLAMRETFGGEQRGIFCGMGVCFDCLVIVNDIPNTRSCMAYVAEGMSVTRQVGRGKQV